MNTIKKNVKSFQIKLITTPKTKEKINNNNRLKLELISKLLNEDAKNIIVNLDQQDSNSIQSETINEKSEKDCSNSNKENNSNNANNNNKNLPNEKSTNTDDSSCEEKIKRNIQVQTPLSLNDIFSNSVYTLSHKKLSRVTLNLNLMNYMTNVPKTNNKKDMVIQENLDEKKDKNKKDLYYREFNLIKSRKNFLTKKTLTEKNSTTSVTQEKNLYKGSKIENTYNIKESVRRRKLFVKNKSYDCLKRKIEFKDLNINTKENEGKKNKENCHYIKVNKKKIDTDKGEYKTVSTNISRAKEPMKIKSSIIRTKNNEDTSNKEKNKNKKNKNEFIKKKKVVINANNNNKNKTKKPKIIDKRKLENNIFLDKTYQNRFKKEQKNRNFEKNDIFTSDRQKEYNTFIVKKKSNYLSNQIINSNNSVSSSNDNNNKDWVYRLYHQEIKKQKIKDKIILLLRKSILKEEKSKKKEKKNCEEMKNYNYPVNEGYNVDDNFNIINLFLSDDKKEKKEMSKKKKMKKCKSFHSYRQKKQRAYSDKKVEDETINKLIEKTYLKNHRSFKKFRLLYNEELINEEDEEKEKDEEEEQG